MLINLFHTVRSSGVPCTLRELLDLLGALEKNLAFADMDDFYFLARTVLVKDEKNYDKFDRAFEIYFKGIETPKRRKDIPSDQAIIRSISILNFSPIYYSL